MAILQRVVTPVPFACTGCARVVQSPCTAYTQIAYSCFKKAQYIK